jgi:SnoaL-like polyketide cyclase.
MSDSASSEAAKAVVRRNTEEVQGRGNFEVFEELFAPDFIDHTPQPNCTPDREGARALYKTLRAAFPDFHAVIHWQAADGELVTTYKTITARIAEASWAWRHRPENPLRDRRCHAGA